MTAIAGVQNLTASRLIREIRQGALFAAFPFGIPTDEPGQEALRVLYLPPKSSRVSVGLKLALRTAMTAWATLPSRPLQIVESIVDFARGGNDLTAPILRNAEHVFDRGFGTAEEIETLKALSTEI